MELDNKLEFAIGVCRLAGETALSYFRDRDNLQIDEKGAQDWVSEADRNVELLIREKIAQAWPTDGIYGEEHGEEGGQSGFDWVIDPIDGTTNFVNGIPNWVIVLAGVTEGRTVVGVIHDPIAGETFAATRGGGATLNGKPIRVAENTALESGTVAVGYSGRVSADRVLTVLAALLAEGAMFHRNASGALSLAYVSAGRLLGYIEEHMNAWDCLAGQLLISEAGGVIEEQNADEMIRCGGRVVAGPTGVFDKLKEIADEAWSS